LANQIIRKNPDVAGRPSTVLVRIFNDHAFAWYRYDYGSGRLERSGIDLCTPLTISDREIKVCFCNSPASLPIFRPLVENLATMGIAVQNMACYLGDLASVFALNYGRE